MNLNELQRAIENSGATWVATENEISKLSDDDKRRMLGAVKPDGYQPPVQRRTMPDIPDLPSSLDWRSVGNFVTPVKHQGACGSCVSFGTMAAMESRFAKEHSMLLNFSEADMYFCSSNGLSCTTGWWPVPAYRANQQRGIIQSNLFKYATAFPQNANTPVCLNVPNRDKNAFTYANITTITTVVDAKIYLFTTGPLAAVFDVYEDFYHYHGGIYKHTSGASKGKHCICIVGYNDNNGDGYWICKNSWGPLWGMDGYFNIAYGQCNIDTNEKVAVSGITKPSQIYVSISSAAYSSLFLRMDGTGVTRPLESGGGTVNCQHTVDSYGKFVITKQSEEIYTIGSVQFPNVLLRMDGTGLTQPSPPGGGIVNCQSIADPAGVFAMVGPNEQFVIRKQPNDTYTIESVHSPNIFLRMVDTGFTQPDSGGVVNCQYTVAGRHEYYFLSNTIEY